MGGGSTSGSSSLESVTTTLSTKSSSPNSLLANNGSLSARSASPRYILTIKQLFEELQHERQAVHNEITALRRQQLIVSNELNEVTKSLHELEQRKHVLEQKNSEIDSRHQTLKHELDSVESRISKFNSQSLLFEQEIIKLTSSCKSKHDPFDNPIDVSDLTLAGHMDGVLCVCFPIITTVVPAPLASATLTADRTSQLPQTLSIQPSDESEQPLQNGIHNESTTSVRFLSSVVVTGSRDRTIRIWDLPTGRCKHVLRGHEGWVHAVAADENRIVSGSGDATIRMWDLSSAACLAVMHGHRGGVSSLQIDHSSLLTGSLDSTIKWWDKHTGQCISTLSGHTKYVKTLHFIDYTLASGGGDCCVRVWDLRSTGCERLVSGHDGGVSCVKVDLARHQLVSGGRDGKLKVWDLRMDNDCIHEENVGQPISTLSFEGDTVLFAAEKRPISMWSLLSKQIVREFSGHVGNISHVCYCAESDIMVSASRDGTAKVWNVGCTVK